VSLEERLRPIDAIFRGERIDYAIIGPLPLRPGARCAAPSPWTC
jgi:hypothetical protein